MKNLLAPLTAALSLFTAVQAQAQDVKTNALPASAVASADALQTGAETLKPDEDILTQERIETCIEGLPISPRAVLMEKGTLSVANKLPDGTACVLEITSTDTEESAMFGVANKDASHTIAVGYAEGEGVAVELETPYYTVSVQEPEGEAEDKTQYLIKGNWADVPTLRGIAGDKGTVSINSTSITIDFNEPGANALQEQDKALVGTLENAVHDKFTAVKTEALSLRLSK